MKILNIDNQERWDDWLKNNSRRNCFTQSWEWGNILSAEGKKVEQLAVVEGEKILAQAQVVYSALPFGWQYATCPKGPVVDEVRMMNDEVRIYEMITNYLKNKNCIFFRIEPVSIIHDSKFIIQKSIDINPSATLILDLKKPEEELLSGMHQKTRYNIHLAEKKKLDIKNIKNIEILFSLMQKTGKRDGFNLHAKKHYASILNSKDSYQLTVFLPITSISNIQYPIATAVFFNFGNTLTYLYGASDYAHRDLMAPYLLQWEGIKMGKSFGCEWYDFFGVAPKKLTINNEQLTTEYNYDLHHQYAGVTRFKLGFGGTPIQAPGTFDVIIDKNKFMLYNFLRKLRRLF